MPTLDERIEAARALTGYSEGPWEIVTDLPAIAIAAGKHRVVQTPNQNNYRHFGRSEQWLGISGFDNADLIAAAPDLHRLALDLAAERERLLRIIWIASDPDFRDDEARCKAIREAGESLE